jgi:diguanylate cyclase (GGDEF)-like protein
VKVPELGLLEADEVGVALMSASRMLRHAQYQANHDALTGLANRVLFKEIVSRQIALCQRNGTRLAVLYIDLDGFKAVNDGHGHAAGDTLLREVAQRLKAGIRASDIAARLGGDEFAVVLVGASTDEAAQVAAKLVRDLSAPYAFDALTLDVSASIGVAGFPESGATGKTLLHRADDAMYEAKALGKARVAVAGRRNAFSATA